MRRVLLVAALAVACKGGEPPATEDAGVDAPSWLGDAGLLRKPPVQRPLSTLCGLASNPGDMPLGDGEAERAKRKGYFDAAKALRCPTIRRDFLWAEIEPEKGKLDFATHDQLVEEANAAGVKLLGMLGYGTPWATAASKGDSHYPPDRNEDFAAFARATAARYRGKVAAWEIWNEPNNGFRFWKTSLYGEPARYGKLLSAAHAAIREAAPETPVLLGGTVFTPQLIHGAIPWLDEAFTANPGLAGSFQIAGIHTYAKYPPERAPELGEDDDAPLEDKLGMFSWLLAKHGAAKAPIWITEIGWPSYGKVDEAKQAQFLVRATILAAVAGAEGIFYYTLRDGPKPNQFPPEDAFGLLRNDSSAKPSFVALQTLFARVGDRFATTKDARVVGLPPDGRAVVFHAPSLPDVIALWTVSSTSEVRLEGRSGAVFDQQGVAKGTASTFTIGPSVTYVEER